MKKFTLSTLAAFAAFGTITSQAATCQHIQAAGGPAYGGCEICEYDPIQYRGDLCKVILINPGRDEFVLMDACGETWVYEGIEDTQPGDFYSVVFDTRHTADLADDIIMSITYERPDLFF